MEHIRREVDRLLVVRVTVCRVTVRNTSRRPLTELQQAILDQLWSNGPAAAEQIREALLPAHRLKDSSVRTLLRRLEVRGYVSHRLDGKTFIYKATMAPKRVAAHSVRQIIDRFWSGSVEQFLTGMVDEKILMPAEIARLARKISHSRKRKNTDA
jgi:BlaI family penicillinase repressor